MSGRFHNSNIYAFDDQGQEHLLSEFYSYSDGCGFYRNCIAINGLDYRVDGCAGDENEFILGEKLPYLRSEDLQSYFTTNPTSELQEALRIAELTDVNLVGFLCVDVDSVLCGPINAFCGIVKKDSVSNHAHSLCKEQLGDDVEAIMQNLLEKYAPMCK